MKHQRPIQNTILTLFLSVITVFLLMAGGCDHTFEPFRGQDRLHFSIYGYLDASADTNWVRVMPMRETLYLADDEPIDAVVTLENLESEQVITLQDSLFEYGNGTYAWNFWTSEKIDPGVAWLLTAKRSDGAASMVVVTVPPDFPPPEVIQRTIQSPIETRVAEVDTLIDLQLFYHFRHQGTGERIVFTNSQLHNVYRLDGEYRTELPYTTGIPSFIEFPHPDHQRVPEYDTITAVSAGTWPLEFFTFPERNWERFGEQFGPLTPDQELLDRLNEVSNVENGLGYLGAVVTRSSSVVICRDEEGIQLPC